MKATAITCPSMVMRLLIGESRARTIGDQIVERAQEPGIQERHDRRVGDDGGGVFRRVRRQRGHLEVAVLGRLVGADLDGRRGAFGGARRHRLERREIVARRARA
jgi:hypothetical protein